MKKSVFWVEEIVPGMPELGEKKTSRLSAVVKAGRPAGRPEHVDCFVNDLFFLVPAGPLGS